MHRYQNKFIYKQNNSLDIVIQLYNAIEYIIDIICKLSFNVSTH